MQRQGALADPAFAGAHGHEMTHPGEPVGDAGALLGNLLENSGPSVANDVVVALHFCGCCVRGLIAYTVEPPKTSSRPGPHVALKSTKRKELSNGDLDCHLARGCALSRAVGSLLHL